MELDEAQFIKNKENDVLDRGTKVEWLALWVARIVFLVVIWCVLERLIKTPDKFGSWCDAFIILVLGTPTLNFVFVSEKATRKKCIKKGQKFAAKLINVDAWDCQDGGRKYTDYMSTFQCLENSKEYVVHFDNLDPREYIENPYCNIYILERQERRKKG